MGDFFQKCIPKYRSDFERCNGMTDCDISPTTEDELASIYADANGKYRIIGALLETDIMGKACQIEENPLYTLIMQYAQHWGPGALTVRKKQTGGLADIQPYLIISRKGIINNNYWRVQNGIASASTAPNGSSYDLRIDADSMTSIPASLEWFPVGLPVFISGRSTAGGNTNTQWEVVDRTTPVGVTGVRLYLKSKNSASRLPSWKTQTPTLGVLLRGVPNVTPWERYCTEIPKLNTNVDYMAFLQHTRWTICNDDLTKQFLTHIRDNNPLYRKYYHVEEGERNRQVLQDFQNRLVHSFLFNKALPNQNSENWDQLETITSWTDSSTQGIYLPGVEGRCVARRANAEGVYEQLQECGRVRDLNGDRMNWPELQAELYNIMRIRKDNGYPYKVIEILVDSAFRPLFIQALIRYQQAKYEGAARYNINPEDKTTNLGFVFTDFILDYPAGLTLRVVSHMALDDLLTAHSAVSDTLSNAGRKMLILEWNSIYMGIIESRTAERRTGTPEEIARVNESALCVFDIPGKSVKLNTMLYSVVVECPRANLWVENFAFIVPEHEGRSRDYSDLYGDDPSNNTEFP